VVRASLLSVLSGIAKMVDDRCSFERVSSFAKHEGRIEDPSCARFGRRSYSNCCCSEVDPAPTTRNACAAQGRCAERVTTDLIGADGVTLMAASECRQATVAGGLL
jgi:hypothetical protein